MNTGGNTMKRKVGEVVLIFDPNQPRNSWKIGRISNLTPSTSGELRTAEVTLPNKRIIQRPLNQLIPLEIPEYAQTMSEKEEYQQKSVNPEDSLKKRYNLRPRKQVNYKEEDDSDENVHSVNILRVAPRMKTSLITCIILTLMLVCTTSANREKGRNLQCTDRGLVINRGDADSYEVCIDSYCWMYSNPKEIETLHIPASVTLHDYEIHWKIKIGDRMKSISKTCQATQFCTNIDCTICTEMLANPSCWPKTTIVTTGIIMYALLLSLYIMCYVPLILGTPIRLILHGLGYILLNITVYGIDSTYSAVKALKRCLTQQQRRPDLWKAATVIALSCILHGVNPCQEVDIFSHTDRICHTNEQGSSCSIRSSQVLRINPYKQEACLILTTNGSIYKEMRIRWKEVRLTCEKETVMFTRSTQYNVLDSKRCPHAGSCTGSKCGNINRKSIVPELQSANRYPGVTGCIESCGGLGCDCFYPSSGCLFYRIFLTPIDDKQYEIYRCTRWKEEVAIRTTIIDMFKNMSKTEEVIIRPNIPYSITNMTITLSELTLPPTPILADYFISGGVHTAKWPKDYIPPLQCATIAEARTLKCRIVEDCSCSPAENTIHCDCKDHNVSQIFHSIENRLPVNSASIQFRENTFSVIATMASLPTAEFILHFDEKATISTKVVDSTCSIEPTHLEGCYACSKGAKAIVMCKSDRVDQMAEVRCEEHSFTIPCSTRGTTSALSFSYDRATIRTKCVIKCGNIQTVTEISGILRYTGNLQDSLKRMVKGESTVFSEINLPDLGHVANVFLHWYITTIVTLIGLLLAIGMTYVYFITCGTRVTYCCVRLFFRSTRNMWKKLILLFLGIFRSTPVSQTTTTKNL